MTEVSASPNPPACPPVAYTRLLIASILCMGMFGAVQVLPAVCLDALGEDLNLDFTQRGLITSIRMAALIASLLIVGHFAERPVKRPILLGGLLAVALGQFLTAWVPDYAALLGAVIISGLGFGIVEAILNPLVAQLHPTRCAWALNVVNGIFSFGLVVGAITTGELLEAGHSWRLPFWLWMFPPLLCIILYLTPRYPSRPPDPGEDRPHPRLRQFLSLPLFWILIAAMILGGGCEAGLTWWAPNFTARELAASPREAAWATILYGTLMGVGRLASGSILNWLSPLRLMIGSAVLCGLVTLGLVFVPTLPLCWALFALSGLFVACFWPTLLAVASDHISSGSTLLFSLMAAAGVSGCVLVPAIIGALGDHFGLRLAVLTLPVSMVLLIAMLIWASFHITSQKSKKREAYPPPAL